MVYVQDVAKMTDYSASAIGINCPNCGAPVRNLGQKFCDYCGTAVEIKEEAPAPAASAAAAAECH